MIPDTHDTFDNAWYEPLPHALSPVKEYLTPIHAETRAVAVFIHGRGDNIDDMVGAFLPILEKRFGHSEHEQRGSTQAELALIGLEARDHVWYPESHHAVGQGAVVNNPYQYSSLEKLRKTLVFLTTVKNVSPAHIILIGFSQGAMLANNYVLAVLNQKGSQTPLLPLPGHILALSGSLFATTPSFPSRSFASQTDKDAHEKSLVDEASQASSHKEQTVIPPACRLRLLCGDSDRFFQPSEIEEAAKVIALAKSKAQSQAPQHSFAKLAADALEISLSIEPNAPHQITAWMIAVLVSTIEEVLTEA